LETEQPGKSFKGYPQVVPDVAEWPIVQMSQRRYEFIKEVIDESFNRCLRNFKSHEELADEFAKTLYQERIRLTQKPWKADAPDENEYWSNIKNQLVKINALPDPPKEPSEELKALLFSVISRYTNEIAGNFDPNIHDFAKVMVHFGFSRLLKTSIGKNFKQRIDRQFSIHDRLKYVGEVEAIRSLAKDHTLIMVPTHSSNLDSMLVGWAIHDIGLPAFIYGAGLNLFGIRILAYFMNRLGAYKVDRRKKNLFYLETLKTYSDLAIQAGCHSIFFPGGTRSRSGHVESKLKLGLLGTAMDAQFENYAKAEMNNHAAKKIIICPVVINYHFVLEAPVLIKEYLQDVGKEQYLGENDKFSTSFKLLRLILKLLTQSSKIYLSFGAPMDLFGNAVNESGKSIDKHGKAINTKQYFMLNSELKPDDQRHTQYIKMLGEKIVESYKKNNVALSSYILAFAAFRLLMKKYKKLDLYALMLLPKEERTINYEELRKVMVSLREGIIKAKNEGRILTPNHFDNRNNAEELMEHGLKNLGLYHDPVPMIKNKQNDFVVTDMKLLFFYHNRLDGYGFEKHI
jgi:glycerol-3-phosphate O-acyltransferase